MRNWDNIFMNMAIEISKLSTCSKLHVGALLVKERRVISTGYNGTFPKALHCNEIFNESLEGHSEWSSENEIHAEINCLIYCALNKVSPEGATLYVTDSPCVDCAKAIIASKIKRVVYLREYRITRGLEILKNYGVILDKVEN